MTRKMCIAVPTLSAPRHREKQSPQRGSSIARFFERT
jgi:hypothetical protein